MKAQAVRHRPRVAFQAMGEVQRQGVAALGWQALAPQFDEAASVGLPLGTLGRFTVTPGLFDPASQRSALGRRHPVAGNC